MTYIPQVSLRRQEGAATGDSRAKREDPPGTGEFAHTRTLLSLTGEMTRVRVVKLTAANGEGETTAEYEKQASYYKPE